MSSLVAETGLNILGLSMRGSATDVDSHWIQLPTGFVAIVHTIIMGLGYYCSWKTAYSVLIDLRFMSMGRRIGADALVSGKVLLSFISFLYMWAGCVCVCVCEPKIHSKVQRKCDTASIEIDTFI